MTSGSHARDRSIIRNGVSGWCRAGRCGRHSTAQQFINKRLVDAADLKTSLTQRGTARSITFATPRTGTGQAPGVWARAVAGADAAAIYMGIGEAAAVTAALLPTGKAPSLPVTVVESASLPHRRILYTTLCQLPFALDAAMAGPAVILLGPQFGARTTGARNDVTHFAPTRRSAA